MRSLSLLYMRVRLLGVTVLTPAAFLACIAALLSACSHLSSPGEDPYLQRRYGDSCKSHAYVQSTLADHLTSRFGLGAPVRMAVVPFSAPANLTAVSSEQPGIGNVLAGQIQSRLLESEIVPIVEVFNRPEWPGKKDEFFSGNFGALQFARDAGYDLVMVGHVASMTSRDAISAFSKIMETDSGITLWYGRTDAATGQRRIERALDWIFVVDRQPSRMYMPELVEQLSRCIVRDATSERLSAN